MRFSRKIITDRMAGGAMLLSAFLLSGCNQRPKEVLSEKKMVALMTDMQLAEAYTSLHINGRESQNAKADLAEGVLEYHGVTREQLDTTLAWYGRNLDDYTALFEKVDKNLQEQRREYQKRDGVEYEIAQGDQLWPYGQNGQISALGLTDGWIFSLNNPDLEKGDCVEWKLHLGSSAPSLSGVLGVEYTDGSAEAVTQVFTGRPAVNLTLQTDTGKLVKRLYGTMRLRNSDQLPLFADSISLHRLPFDSLEYSKFRSQKKYGIPVRKGKPVEKNDTTVGKEDEKVDSLKSSAVVAPAVGKPAIRQEKAPVKARSIEEKHKESLPRPGNSTRQKVRRKTR